MKYNLLLLKDLFFKKILKYFVLELIFIIIFLKINLISDGFFLVFSLNKITFYDQIRDLIKLISFIIIIYATVNYYLYEFFQSPEFTILRETNKSHFIKKTPVIVLFNIIIKTFEFIILWALFQQFNYIQINLLFCGLLNIIYISLITMLFINLLAQKKHFFSLILFVLFICDFFNPVNNVIYKIIVIFILYFSCYYSYSIQKIYNRYIK